MFGKIRRWIYSITHPVRKGKLQASIINKYYSKELLENAEQYMTVENHYYCFNKLPKTDGNFIQWTKIETTDEAERGQYESINDYRLIGSRPCDKSNKRGYPSNFV